MKLACVFIDDANLSQFCFIGVTYFVPTAVGRGWMQNMATAMYAVASSSGSIFFALNFGDEGEYPSTSLRNIMY